MGAILLILFGVSGAFYGVAVLVLYLRQRALQYRPTHLDSLGKGNSLFKPWLNGKGEFLGYFRAVSTPRRLVLFFHGSGGEALDRAWIEEIVSKKDLLLLAEYPGYGARKGQPSQAAILADAQSLVQEAQSKWGKLPVLAVGEKMGSAVVAYLASVGIVDRLALISPLASAEDIAVARYKFFPVKWLLKDKYPTLSWIRSAKAPLQVVHGTLDQLVPLEQGRAVFHAHSGPEKHFEEVPGFNHANLDQALLHSPFTSRFRDFLNE